MMISRKNIHLCVFIKVWNIKFNMDVGHRNSVSWTVLGWVIHSKSRKHKGFLQFHHPHLHTGCCELAVGRWCIPFIMVTTQGGHSNGSRKVVNNCQLLWMNDMNVKWLTFSGLLRNRERRQSMGEGKKDPFWF